MNLLSFISSKFHEQFGVNIKKYTSKDTTKFEREWKSVAQSLCDCIEMKNVE